MYWYAAQESLICNLIVGLGLTALVYLHRGQRKGDQCERAGMERDLSDSLCCVQSAAALDSVGTFSTLGNTLSADGNGPYILATKGKRLIGGSFWVLCDFALGGYIWILNDDRYRDVLR